MCEFGNSFLEFMEEMEEKAEEVIQSSSDIIRALDEERRAEDNSCDVVFHVIEVGGLSRPPTEVSSVSTDNIPDFLTDGTKDFLSADLPSDDPAGGVGREGPPSYRCVLAHKLVLKMKSPVFKRQFFGSLSRNVVSGPEVVEIKDSTYQGFEFFINVIYTHLKLIDRCTSIEVLFDILQLSDRFDTGDIHDKAQQCIANFRITAENSLDVLKVLNYYRHLLNFSGVCEGLGRRCAEIINADFRSVRDVYKMLEGQVHESPDLVPFLLRLLQEVDKPTDQEKSTEEKLATLEATNKSFWSLKIAHETLEAADRSTQTQLKITRHQLKQMQDSISALRSERNELQERLNELQCKNCRADRENCEHDCVVTDPKEGLHVWNKGACATIVLVVDCDDDYNEQSFIALDNGKRIQFGRRPIPEMIHSLKYNCHCPCIQEDNQYYHEY